MKPAVFNNTWKPGGIPLANWFELLYPCCRLNNLTFASAPQPFCIPASLAQAPT